MSDAVRRRRAEVFALALIAAAFAATGGQAVGGSPATVSSTTQFEASATLVTPPDEVGYRINVEIAGQIVATGHSKVVQSCRGARTVEITWTRLDGTVPQGNATQPSSRKGHFSAEASFDYGHDVPEARWPVQDHDQRQEAVRAGQAFGHVIPVQAAAGDLDGRGTAGRRLNRTAPCPSVGPR